MPQLSELLYGLFILGLSWAWAWALVGYGTAIYYLCRMRWDRL